MIVGIAVLIILIDFIALILGLCGKRGLATSLLVVSIILLHIIN